MPKQNNIFFRFDNVVQCLQLSNGHSLILYEIKIDRIAVKSVHADESQNFSLVVYEINHF